MLDLGTRWWIWVLGGGFGDSVVDLGTRWWIWVPNPYISFVGWVMLGK